MAITDVRGLWRCGWVLASRVVMTADFTPTWLFIHTAQVRLSCGLRPSLPRPFIQEQGREITPAGETTASGRA